MLSRVDIGADILISNVSDAAAGNALIAARLFFELSV
jgi:hypothetical protein